MTDPNVVNPERDNTDSDRDDEVSQTAEPGAVYDAQTPLSGTGDGTPENDRGENA